MKFNKLGGHEVLAWNPLYDIGYVWVNDYRISSPSNDGLVFIEDWLHAVSRVLQFKVIKIIFKQVFFVRNWVLSLDGIWLSNSNLHFVILMLKLKSVWISKSNLYIISKDIHFLIWILFQLFGKIYPILKFHSVYHITIMGQLTGHS